MKWKWTPMMQTATTTKNDEILQPPLFSAFFRIGSGGAGCLYISRKCIVQYRTSYVDDIIGRPSRKPVEVSKVIAPYKRLVRLLQLQRINWSGIKCIKGSSTVVINSPLTVNWSVTQSKWNIFRKNWK